MECSQPVDETDQTLGCLCQRWSTDDKTDHKVESCTFMLKRSSVKVRDWFGSSFSAVLNDQCMLALVFLPRAPDHMGICTDIIFIGSSERKVMC